MARRRFKDRLSLGRSQLVPCLHGETASARHFRRKWEAVRFQNWLAKELEPLGLTVEVKNQGHHWIVTKPGFRAEWWPSSAKLVFNKAYTQGIHCHDRMQFVAAVRAKMTKS